MNTHQANGQIGPEDAIAEEAIAWLIRYLQSNSLRVFIVYRIIAGVVVIALAFAMHLQ